MDEMVEGDATQTLAKRLHERDMYLNKLSDRTRTLCLGTLALIWGIFSQKDTGRGYYVQRPGRIALAVVGMSAIFVLVLEFGEYLCAYQFRRELAAEKIWPRITYGKLEKIIRFSKIVLGALTLVALCITLACILASSLSAQPPREYPFLGKWCGGSVYTCLLVTQPTDTVRVRISYVQEGGWIDCLSVEEGEKGELKAWCDGFRIAASLCDKDTTKLKLHLENEGRTWEAIRTLKFQADVTDPPSSDAKGGNGLSPRKVGTRSNNESLREQPGEIVSR